jgi:fructokinase
LDVAGFPVNLVDTVGAGDTYIANLLSELMSAGSLGAGPSEKISQLTETQLIEFSKTANAAAAIVCERTGCQPPTKPEILARIGG